MYLVFTRMPGESYRRRLRSLLLYLCYVFRALINSLVCCCCSDDCHLVPDVMLESVLWQDVLMTVILCQTSCWVCSVAVCSDDCHFVPDVMLGFVLWQDVLMTVILCQTSCWVLFCGRIF